MKSYYVLKLTFLLCFTTLITLSSNAQSSKKATAIANKVVKAMGGMEHYNNTHFIKWDFAKRTLFWDKWTGDVRIESPENNLVILVNINTLKGKVFKNNLLVQDETKQNELLVKGKNWWINDSYWLVMPWKLQDPGVTLSHVKTETLNNGHTADVLQLTFNDVGVTPENKYYIYVDQTDNLIKQWEFFPNFNDAEPKFILPWDNYQNTGNILLSFNRSKFGPKNVEVSQEMNKTLFAELNYK
ncbi:hypothetical protein CLV33_101723 [Jejuia pallidilutea]|uniref:Outer membrane lipoprotein-sorting protein n=1 Tax=Jejuia pallidilutea TaxID=504487 RepID=A0A362XEX5_9FLAO|nr:hypothetical protein [Jejuia pallidilutea]PQV51790.1 hypothetical protein CLV33_101723 [Jejuia pallidilutea]